MWTLRTLKRDKSSLVFIIEVEHGLQLHIVQLAAAAAAFHGVLELGKSELSYSNTCSISIEKPLISTLDVVFTFAGFILHSLLVSHNPDNFRYDLPPAGREPSALRKSPVFPWIPT